MKKVFKFDLWDEYNIDLYGIFTATQDEIDALIKLQIPIKFEDDFILFNESDIEFVSDDLEYVKKIDDTSWDNGWNPFDIIIDYTFNNIKYKNITLRELIIKINK